jgi:RNA polymerase sigma-70 factor (ECF subfamily)
MVTAQLPILSPSTRMSSAGPSAPRRASMQVCEVGALLTRVAGGDTQAFEDLYERTVHRVYGLVRKVLVDAEMSAETTQDVFLALWVDGAARFDPAQGTGMSWVMTIAHRRAVDKVAPSKITASGTCGGESRTMTSTTTKQRTPSSSELKPKRSGRP